MAWGCLSLEYALCYSDQLLPVRSLVCLKTAFLFIYFKPNKICDIFYYLIAVGFTISNVKVHLTVKRVMVFLSFPFF